MSKIFQKLEKSCKIVQICAILASGCSSVARIGVGGVALRADEGNSGVGGVKSAGGWGQKWGSTVEGSSTSKNRPSHHNYKSPKQFELKQS